MVGMDASRRCLRLPAVSASLLAAAVALSPAVSCREAQRPVEYGEPAQYVLATPASFGCGAWYPAAPPERAGLFDVYYGNEGLAPSMDDVQRAVHAGGAIVAHFHLPGFRAILPTAAVPDLGAMLVRSVTDASKLYQEVFVRFLAGTTDTDIVAANGGRVLNVYASLAIVFASLPDSAIPNVRADPRVADVGFNGIMCPAQRGREPVVLPR